MSKRISLPETFFFLLLAALITGGAAVAEPDTADLTELWRAGGEDDEVFFGSVAAIRTDSEDNILLLDGQLSEVHVFSPDGEHLRTVFREGDGPGEIRQPNDMFVTADGTVCALSGFPGKIVKVSADGTPAGQASFSLGEGAQVPMGVLNRGFDMPEGILLVGIRMVFSGTVTTQTYFLSLCTDEGVQKTALVEKNNDIDYSDFVMTETGLDFVWNRVAVDPQGTIYVAPERNQYEIKVFDRSGAAVRTISRAYTQENRDKEEKKAARQILEAIAAYYPRPPHSYTTEETQAAIAGMWATDDGRLWVQTGDAHKATPEGSWIVLDVFAPDGKFEKQVALPGSYQARQDALFVQPDGRIIVVVGALDAFLNQQAVSSDEGGGESTAQPLEVICYRMGP
ncbi:MAG: 6-bladed beta-propeller [Candidatus Krumholzibacteriota bacterium]